MAKTFKVGDKVRILDASKVVGAVDKGFETGGIYEVSYVRSNGTPELRVGVKELYFYEEELRYIELADAKPTKKQRIKALEIEVEALKVRIKALEGGVVKNDEAGRSYVVDTFRKALENAIKQQTPNQRRKAVIERAKAFVADVEIDAKSDTRNNEGNYTFNDRITISEFHVNAKKRCVTVLIKSESNGDILEKAIARCAPGDVFNVHIGKAIALAKAYGLECPQEFTNAPQPEPAVGQRIEVAYLGGTGIFGVDTPDKVYFDGRYFAMSKNGRGLVNGCGTKTAFAKGSKILDDSEAVYD